MKNGTGSLFSQELQEALKQSKVSVQDAVQLLNNYGHAVPMKTFLYWLEGYFLPRHVDAFLLVETLERIFGIRDSGLRNALLDDLASAKSFVPPEYRTTQGALQPHKVGDDREKYLESSDDKTDWDEEIIREVIHDAVTINAERDYIHHRTTIFGRVPSGPAAFLNFPIIYEGEEEKPEPEKILYDVRGGKIVEQTLYEEDGILNVATRLALSDETISGALHRISFTSDFCNPNGYTRVAERFFAFPLAFYSCTVTFEGEVPDTIEYVFSTSDERRGRVKDTSVTPLVPIGNTVRVSRGNVFSGTGCVRWQ